MHFKDSCNFVQIVPFMTAHIPIADSPSSPPTPIARDWFGEPARHRAAFRLWLASERLHFYFQAGKAPECDLTLQPGDFVEGLWHKDVAELFLMGPDGRYQELNLSPRGAWWCAVFSGYRQREKAWAPPGVEVAGGRDDGRWWAELSIPLSDLEVLPPGGLSQARLNVAAILGPERPEYLSFGHHQGGEPDFHDERNFCEISLR